MQDHETRMHVCSKLILHPSQVLNTRANNDVYSRNQPPGDGDAARGDGRAALSRLPQEARGVAAEERDQAAAAGACEEGLERGLPQEMGSDI